MSCLRTKQGQLLGSPPALGAPSSCSKGSFQAGTHRPAPGVLLHPELPDIQQHVLSVQEFFLWGGTLEWFLGAGKAVDEAQAVQCHVLTQQIFRDRIQHFALYFPPAPSSA